MLAEVDAFAPQLILLDISLPFFNGFHWCAELRRRSCVPIIFLSSASDQMNAVMAMQLGGDDLLAKPFDLQVLSAKVQALLRRAHIASEQQILVGNTRLDSASYTVTCRGQTWSCQRRNLTFFISCCPIRGRSLLAVSCWTMCGGMCQRAGRTRSRPISAVCGTG